MKFLRKYSSIRGLMNRFTILKIGRIHIRLHDIFGKDLTSLYHNHPFHYISFIYRGGYEETVLVDGVKSEPVWHLAPKIIFRRRGVYHRIENTLVGTKTLFMTYGNYPWTTKNPDGTSVYEDGLYINKDELYQSIRNGSWMVPNKCYEKARRCTQTSIHQLKLDGEMTLQELY